MKSLEIEKREVYWIEILLTGCVLKFAIDFVQVDVEIWCLGPNLPIQINSKIDQNQTPLH